MKALGATVCTVGTLALAVLAGGSPERDVFVKVTVAGEPIAPDTVLISAASEMPTSVALGQQGVPAYTVSIVRISDNWGDPIYLVGMGFRFESLDGSPIDPYDVVSQMRIELEGPAESSRVSQGAGPRPAGSGAADPSSSEPRETTSWGMQGDTPTHTLAASLPTAMDASRMHASAARRRVTRAFGARLEVDLSKPALVSTSEVINLRCYVDIATDTHVSGFAMILSESSLTLEAGDSPDPAVILDHEGPPGTTLRAQATIVPQTLQDSFTNYPNPFAAGRELTTFAFYLRDEAEVRLRLFTGFGRLIKTLDPGSSRRGGLVHEDIRWDGTDERGMRVQNGAYFAVLDVRYPDGAEDQAMRKVAVLR